MREEEEENHTLLIRYVPQDSKENCWNPVRKSAVKLAKITSPPKLGTQHGNQQSKAEGKG